MIRARLIVLCFIAFGALVACEAETGPGPEKRQNGCIDTECNSSSSSSSSSSSGGSDAGGDAQ